MGAGADAPVRRTRTALDPASVAPSCDSLPCWSCRGPDGYDVELVLPKNSGTSSRSLASNVHGWPAGRSSWAPDAQGQPEPGGDFSREIPAHSNSQRCAGPITRTHARFRNWARSLAPAGLGGLPPALRVSTDVDAACRAPRGGLPPSAGRSQWRRFRPPTRTGAGRSDLSERPGGCWWGSRCSMAG